MSLINSKLCKFEIDYAIFFSIISRNTIATAACEVPTRILRRSEQCFSIFFEIGVSI